MAAFVTCDKLLDAILAVLATATPDQRAMICDLLDCSVNSGSILPGLALPGATTEEPELPTTMYGARTALLGDPTGWIDVGGFRVPHYGPSPCP